VVNGVGVTLDEVYLSGSETGKDWKPVVGVGT
jgi:hypothetical protein